MTTPTSLTTVTVTLPELGPVPVTVQRGGSGRPVLLLHGGAGLPSVTGFADLLGRSGPYEVVVPVHPGFAGTPRPEGLQTMGDLARVYRQLLAELDLTEVTVVGNSIGGWVAAELALLGDSRVSRVVLVDAVGLSLPGHPTMDFFSLTMDQVIDLSYYRPDAFRRGPADLTEEQQAQLGGNRAALHTYGGDTMTDPALLGRLGGITVPTLVVWGAADRIVDPSYGAAYAEAIPGARLEIIPDAGHLPQLETPDKLRDLVREFVGA